MTLIVTIVRAEGPNETVNKPFQADKWHLINTKLSTWSWSAPTKGYDKVDFEILDAGTVVYRGRYDLVTWKYGVPDLSKQVVDQLERMANNRQLTMFERGNAQLLLNRIRKEL